MESFENKISEFSPENAREIVYFLIRYFKSARFLEEGGRDIFADVFDKEPAPEIKSATLDSIASIEDEMGSKAVDFDDELSDKVLDTLTDLESSLNPVSSKETMIRASSFLTDN